VVSNRWAFRQIGPMQVVGLFAACLLKGIPEPLSVNFQAIPQALTETQYIQFSIFIKVRRADF
jgi:hypothetical protein